MRESAAAAPFMNVIEANNFVVDREANRGDAQHHGQPHLPLTAIDLYSGVGGWALGLKMAGISVAASYELSKYACDTYLKNQGNKVVQCDIRAGALPLPPHVDVVVGSPPCTEFSFSNRGGGGDIENGLKDLECFLTVVADTKPRYWVFENVPRVKTILLTHVYGHKGKLKAFRPLFDDPDVHVRIFNMAVFGLPQKRLRCIAGRYPASLLESYSARCSSKTLGDVIQSLQGDTIADPNYNIELPRTLLTDHDLEPQLTKEEIRLNRDSKQFHPIYNRMSFPDRPDRAVRAITATCTRVSRESVIIRDVNQPRRLRRLSLRERACLQGFPITYQFYGRSHSKKMELIGNAIPPLFSYYVGCALLGVSTEDLKHPTHIEYALQSSPDKPPVTLPSGVRNRYPSTRRFKATIPTLRFKSGVRFELTNEFRGSSLCWRVDFFFGNSKDIRRLRPDGRYRRKLENFLRRHRLLTKTRRHLALFHEGVAKLDAGTLQRRWTHQIAGDGPHTVVDAIARLAQSIAGDLTGVDEKSLQQCLASMGPLNELPKSSTEGGYSINQRKFERNTVALLAGLMSASWFNSCPRVQINKLGRISRRA